MERRDPFLIPMGCGQLLGHEQILHCTNLPNPSQLHDILSYWYRTFGLRPHAL